MKPKIVKTFWIFAGSLFTLLGILGVFLPILPVLPFLFLASTCFFKGSKRLHTKFQRVFFKNRFYEKYLKRHVENENFLKWAKIFFILWSWSFAAYSYFIVFDSLITRLGAVAVAIGVTIFITTLNPLKKSTAN